MWNRTMDVKTTDKADIEAARKAYDELTDDQKKLVSDDAVKRLEAVEDALGKTGVIREEARTYNGAPKAIIEMDEGMVEDLLTPQEKEQKAAGTQVLVYMDVTNIEDTVSEEEKALAIAAALNKDSRAHLAMILDLSLFKQVGEEQPQQITEVPKVVTTTITIPENLCKSNRRFFVVRVHDGEAAIVGEGTGDSIAVKSDLFSTYAVFYVDETEPVPATTRYIMLSQKGTNSAETVTMDEKVIVVPKFADDQGWPVKKIYSSNRRVADIDPKSGEMTLKKAGKTTIRVRAKKGRRNVYARVRVTVMDPTIPSKISIDQGNEITLYVGKEDNCQLTVTVDPVETASSEVTWKSFRKSVVTVDASGKLTPKKSGKAMITAVSKKDRKRKAHITVKVAELTVPTGIELTTETGSTTLTAGQTLQLKYTLTGPDAKVPVKSAVTWTSKQAKIAKVSRDGLVTACKPGTATIIARTRRGKVSASITITVEPSGANSENEAEPDEEPIVSDNIEEAVENTTVELTED